MTEVPCISWDHTWMRVAHVMSRRSPCAGRQVGAVLVNTLNDRFQTIISTGYNVVPRNLHIGETTEYMHSRSCDLYCPRRSGERGQGYDNCYAVHAEANAIMAAEPSRRNTSTLYVTSAPCFACCKLIANSGIERVVYWDNPADAHYDATPGLKLLYDIVVDCVGGPEWIA